MTFDFTLVRRWLTRADGVLVLLVHRLGLGGLCGETMREVLEALRCAEVEIGNVIISAAYALLRDARFQALLGRKAAPHQAKTRAPTPARTRGFRVVAIRRPKPKRAHRGDPDNLPTDVPCTDAPCTAQVLRAPLTPSLQIARLRARYHRLRALVTANEEALTRRVRAVARALHAFQQTPTYRAWVQPWPGEDTAPLSPVAGAAAAAAKPVDSS